MKTPERQFHRALKRILAQFPGAAATAAGRRALRHLTKIWSPRRA